MTYIKTTIVFIVGFFFLSCHRSIDNIAISQSATEDAFDIFPVDTLLKKEYVYVDMYVIGDSLVLGYKNTSKLRRGQKVFDVYNVRSKVVQNAFLQFGNYESPFLAGTLYNCGDTLLVHEFISKVLYFIPLSQEIIEENFVPTAIDFPYPSQRLHLFGGGILKLNPYHFVGKDGQRLNKNTVRIQRSGFSQEKADKIIDCFNVSRGHLGVKNDKSRIVYVDAYQRRIEYYDPELNLIKTIIGPGTDEYEIDVQNMYNKYLEAVYVGFVPESFVDIAYNNDFVYAAFTGQTKCNDEDRKLFSTFILKFNWDGGLLATYRIGSYVKTMNLSDDGETLFVYGQDNTTDYSVVAYKF